MLNLYKQAFDKVEVPTELISKTLHRTNQARSDQKKTRRAPRVAIFGALAAACIAIAVILPIMLRSIAPGSDLGIFITKPEAGTHLEHVELVNGYLAFTQETESLEGPPPLKLGGPGIRFEEWTPERYEEYLGFRASPVYLPDGMFLAEESAIVYRSAEGDILMDSLTMLYKSDVSSLEISISKVRLPQRYDDERAEDSHIGEHSLAVGIFDAGTYWAQFMLGGAGFYIEAVGVTQEEFIRTLHIFFE